MFLPDRVIMCDFGQDDNLETDDMIPADDFSLMSNRLDSFVGSSLAQQVSAVRLARAGFYFTGQADRVRCFCCKKTVENWSHGDAPVERHKEVIKKALLTLTITFLAFLTPLIIFSTLLQASPTCTFLRCAHLPSVHPLSDSTLTNGSGYNEEAEDMEYRLRTGEVVDESTYPMAPHMRNEEARLQTFSSWPSNAPVRPRDLAQAGLYYQGTRDQVQCFCCGGMLAGWEDGDTAWDEHSRHFPNCFFILGHDVGNIPYQGGMEEEESSSTRPASTRTSMGSFEERLDSFAGIQHPVDPERLARAGFYSTGRARTKRINPGV